MTFVKLVALLLPIVGPSNDNKLQRQVTVQVTPIVNAQKHVTVTVSPVIKINISVAVGSGASASTHPGHTKQAKRQRRPKDGRARHSGKRKTIDQPVNGSDP
jgi:hypothetical protein